ncbi:glycogen debranching protein GlgX [Edaphobacter paludis]|uniref:Glycogen debranching protein GlgX n=1 Tax=Edaphobacter paludis TaxID=3035702 RepID=A0AAU7D0F9_9BACT
MGNWHHVRAEPHKFTSQERSVSHPYPLGPTVSPDGTNFSVFSATATGMEIVLFDHVDSLQPARIIRLDPDLHRTSHYWHIFVPAIRSGQLYGYRAYGPDNPSSGHRFDSQKVLIDPYGKSVAVGKLYSRAASSQPGNNAASAMKTVVADLSNFDWEGDRPLNRSFRETVIYEMHVGGFTRHHASGLDRVKRGTYLGVIEKISYLQELGITAVELLPIFQFDAQDAPPGLSNYWGYSPVSFFAPHLAYSTSSDPIACLDEFRTMVKELHRAGIEVILDVVYNHTAESDEHGPTLCFRGLENSFYYLLNKDKSTYANYTGAGNTLKANHSVVKRLILDSLRYWVSEMHVDGFRFDLASIFSRSESGEPMVNSPIVWEIDSDPVLAGTKLIAEAWDKGGLYQVGSFGQDKWKEWNGQFRDDIRCFVRGDPNTVLKLRERLTGSLDLYRTATHSPAQSINFVTCHDGFTLNDLVSYNSKHNEANHELNRDGTDVNFSWNCGIEGPTNNAEITILRAQQMKNFFTLTLISAGTPMILMGDEVRRTQSGNNNPYCQDNETSWFDWGLCAANCDLLRFVQLMIRIRLNFGGRGGDRQETLEEYLSRTRIEWHGVKLGKPDWNSNSHSIAFSLQDSSVGQVHYIAINAYWKPLEFELPPVTNEPNGGWLRLIDTSLPSPDDIVEERNGIRVDGTSYAVNPRSIVILYYNYIMNNHSIQIDCLPRSSEEENFGESTN